MVRPHRAPVAPILVALSMLAPACIAAETAGDSGQPTSMAAVPATGGTPTATAASPEEGASPEPERLTKLEQAQAHLKHLIFIVQENRSFDHYFGTFPGADGRPAPGLAPE